MGNTVMGQGESFSKEHIINQSENMKSVFRLRGKDEEKRWREWGEAKRLEVLVSD